MTFNPGANDVKSLLALLKSTQDGQTPASSSSNPAPPAAHGWHQDSYDPTQPSTSSHGRTAPTSSVIPTQRQLDDLLASLNPKSAFGGGSRSLIQPFGPVAKTASSSTGPSRQPEDAAGAATGAKESEDTGGYSFTQSLPIISTLLADEGFKKELKILKTAQDALERRLWAKQEKIKAEHERSLGTEREIARITGKAVTTEKRAEQAAELQVKLRDFYLTVVLSFIDDLASKHREKLVSLGVPGLGGDESDGRGKKIMDLLQAGMEE